MKNKNRISAIKQMIYQQKFENKFYVLLNYLEDLSTTWNLIVISDNEKDFKLLRTFEDNKIFFYLSKDNTNVNPNLVENQPSSISNKDKSKEKANIGNEYVNVILYFKNGL